MFCYVLELLVSPTSGVDASAILNLYCLHSHHGDYDFDVSLMTHQKFWRWAFCICNDIMFVTEVILIAMVDGDHSEDDVLSFLNFFFLFIILSGIKFLFRSDGV